MIHPQDIYEARWARALKDLLRFTAVSEMVAGDHVSM
jgi:hypothetical protein